MFHPDFIAQPAAALLAKHQRDGPFLHTPRAVPFPIIMYKGYNNRLAFPFANCDKRTEVTMIGQTGIMWSYKKTGMIVDRPAAFTDKRIDAFIFYIFEPALPRYAKTQGFMPPLLIFRIVPVSQRFSFFHFALGIKWRFFGRQFLICFSTSATDVTGLPHRWKPIYNKQQGQSILPVIDPDGSSSVVLPSVFIPQKGQKKELIAFEPAPLSVSGPWLLSYRLVG